MFVMVALSVAAFRRYISRQDEALLVRTRQLESEIADRKQAEREFSQLLEQQKEQIAYDLHDGLAQVLTATAMKTKHLQLELEAEFSSHSSAAAAIVKLMNDAVGQTRDIARGLCPIDNEAAELVSAVRTLATDTARSFGVRCRSKSSHSHLRYNRTAAVHIYRIAQQAIDNAIRHGAAKSIEIELEQDQLEFRMVICDDGDGFDRAGERGAGLGLRSMAFRADVIGGMFKISSRVPGGTAVEVKAPLSTLLAPDTTDSEAEMPAVEAHQN